MHFVCFCWHNLRAVRRGKVVTKLDRWFRNIGTTCVRYAEAKLDYYTQNLAKDKAQPACGTPRQSFFVLVGLRSFAGTTCVRYAEAKIPGKEISDLPIGGTTCVR